MPIVINRVIIMIIAREYFRLQFARSYLTERRFIYFIAKNLINDKYIRGSIRKIAKLQNVKLLGLRQIDSYKFIKHPLSIKLPQLYVSSWSYNTKQE